jgi:ribose 1,5-bisphosphokinase PhnN
VKMVCLRTGIWIWDVSDMLATRLRSSGRGSDEEILVKLVCKEQGVNVITGTNLFRMHGVLSWRPFGFYRSWV